MKGVMLAGVASALLSGTALLAHHSYADFDLQRTVSVEGTISQVLYANPHVMLTIATPEHVTFTAEWANCAPSRRAASRSVRWPWATA
jgi:hypothetical protein